MAATAENLQRPTNPLDGIEDWARRHTCEGWEMRDDEADKVPSAVFPK